MGKLLIFVSLVIWVWGSRASEDEVKRSREHQTMAYIVHVEESMKPDHFSLHEHWYAAMIEEVSQYSKSGTDALLYTYDTVAHGFAAKMSSTEAEAMEHMEGCLGVFPDSLNQVHTTRSPEFLGLSPYRGLWPRSYFGDYVIVGVIDTGIWPESRSFSDRGLGPVPPRWKGECEAGVDFNSSHCNNKLIGARYFLKGYEASYGPIDETQDYRSARDSNGHGTHTSSTVAGAAVPGASLLGYAKGTARGMAPKARLAIYKACWPRTCTDSDVLMAIEKAVSDGVDILSVSLGPQQVGPYYSDPIAIGAFEAIQKGVFVSCSAGNDGPTPSLIYNTAPWITTVGASNIDRDFPAPVTVGDGKIYPGISLYKGPTTDGQLPLAYGRSASSNDSAKFCLAGSLDPKMVRGKLVLCDPGGGQSTEQSLVVQQAGGAGMIVTNDPAYGDQLWAFSYVSPATLVGFRSGEKIKAYINSTKNATARIEIRGLTVIGNGSAAPAVAAFSSRGPNPVVPEILKPDVVGPGLNILAAWTGVTSPSELPSDERRVDYNIISGTSMSCPHVTGIAALIRAAHPSWSAAAIRSALITSSGLTDNTQRLITDLATSQPANAFAAGAGHVNPEAALSPGLVYDLDVRDYFDFVCSLNYTRRQVSMLTRHSFSCPRKSSRTSGPGHINYPSFSVVFKPGKSVQAFRRTVTNVGGGPAVYSLLINAPSNVKISVEPTTLVLEEQNQKASFMVIFESKLPPHSIKGSHQEFGYLAWKCIRGGQHVVRSPIAMVWQIP